MNILLKLLTMKGIFFVLLIVPFGVMHELGVDPRFGMGWVGLMFFGHGLGRFQLAREEEQRRTLNKVLGGLSTLFGVFILFMSALMLVTGQQMQMGS